VKVYILPADLAACGYYRLIWPAKILQRQGFDVTIIPPQKDQGIPVYVGTTDTGQRIVKGVVLPADADVIVLQRPSYELHTQMVEVLQANNVAVVVDMDDDMTNIHPRNIAYHTYKKSAQMEFHWRYASNVCRVATLVTTSTSELQKVYASHGRGIVLDNYVPELFLQYPREKCGYFGWTGTVYNHPDDPAVAGPAVRKLIDDGHRFQVVGPGFGLMTAFRLLNMPKHTGGVPFESWIDTITRTLDVGIAPLAMTPFNTSKSRLKPIEYMSLGIPWVGSPRAEYRRLVKESNCGFLADTTKQWYTMVKRLLIDDELYTEQSEAGRAYMMTQTYEKQAWRWAEAWTHAYNIQRGKV
jgi:glycosyltransferase involved in cell wall biosynthesis